MLSTVFRLSWSNLFILLAMLPSVTFHTKQILITQDNQFQYLNFWGKKEIYKGYWKGRIFLHEKYISNEDMEVNTDLCFCSLWHNWLYQSAEVFLVKRFRWFCLPVITLLQKSCIISFLHFSEQQNIVPICSSFFNDCKNSVLHSLS